MRKVRIFDTTLRDGEQAPGASMTLEEKIAIAKQLEKMHVDIIEAGFPIASEEEFASVSKIAGEIKGATIAGLCRTSEKDIRRCWDAVKNAEKPRIHTFLATSKIHMETKLKKTEKEVKEIAGEMVGLAGTLCKDVEFSAEDASRSETDFLMEVFEIAVNSGATTLNIPDTVGYAQPGEFGKLVKTIAKAQFVKNAKKEMFISVHCHNDLGLAVANSLAGVENGAAQVECTINGLGERAGNASLEEVVMNLKTRKAHFNAETNVTSEELYRASKLVSSITGLTVQRNKAIVGANAFAHEAGVHQHGILCNRLTYEIMTPESVGWTGENIVIGKHSGRHAVSSVLKNAGLSVPEETLLKIVEKVKALADKQKEVESDDVVAIAEDLMQMKRKKNDLMELTEFTVMTGSNTTPTATVKAKIHGEERVYSATGIGVVDAAYKAMGEIAGVPLKLHDYELKAVTGGSNALANIKIVVEDGKGRKFSARAVHEDVITASVFALVNAYNRALARNED